MGGTMSNLSISPAIDSFDSSPFSTAHIAKNEELKDFWDLEENVGFRSFQDTDGTEIKVIQTPDSNADEKAFSILKMIRQYMYELKRCLVQALALHPIQCKHVRDEIILFIVTKCTLQEIPVNKTFEGLNKPRRIVHNQNIDDLQLEKDNQYRSGLRHILLKIRSINNRGQSKFKPWTNIKQLILHEWSHTFCNHIEYRDAGNHAKDFKRCESFLKQFCSNNASLKLIEKQISQLIS